jgi:hypothetical protein
MMQDRVSDMTALRLTMKLCARTAACAVIAVALTGVAAAQAENEKSPLDDAPDMQLFRSLLGGLGVKRGDEAEIEYRERSPLVIPPEPALPPPEPRSLAERTPSWPVDQDVKRAKEFAAAQRKRDPHYSDVEDGRALRPSEMTPGPRGRAPTVIGRSTTPEEGAKTLSPSALGYVGNLFDSVFDRGKVETKPFTGEPPRAALTEPPPGYQTPSPKYKYGAGKQLEAEAPLNPMDQPAR